MTQEISETTSSWLTPPTARRCGVAREMAGAECWVKSCRHFLLTSINASGRGLRPTSFLLILSLISALGFLLFLSSCNDVASLLAKNRATMSEQRKAVIKNADMDEKLQQDAVDIASRALSEYNIEKVLARAPTFETSAKSLCLQKMMPARFLVAHFLCYSDRMLQLTSRKNSIENMDQHGTFHFFVRGEYHQLP
jgi:hypothetical protein